MRFTLAALPLIALAAPAGAQSTYRATGTEPFWRLTMDAQTITLEEPGQRPIKVPRPPAQPSFHGERFVTRGMNVDLTRAHCSDGMSDQVYRDMVMVQVGQRTLRGCGSPVAAPPAKPGPPPADVVRPVPGRPPVAVHPVAPSLPIGPRPVPGGPAGSPRSVLTDTQWTVWQVNGRALPATLPMTVNFTRDRVEGKLCNRFGGPYRLNGEQLQTGGMAATRMACQGLAMAAENTIFAMLRRPVRATVSRWGTLILTGGRDTVTLRPVRR